MIAKLAYLTTPVCSKCGLTNDRTPQRYCSGCHMVYMRGWRAKQRVSYETVKSVSHRVPEAIGAREG